MRPIHLALIAFSFTLPLPSAAQSGTTEPQAAASAGNDQLSPNDQAAVSDDQAAPKKKGGLWGRAKGIAKNKVVQQVAKTAACTMVPGGHVIAGAIDAASTKSAGEAARGAAGAATGTNCMPGGMGAAGASGAAGVAAQAVVGRGAPGAMLGGLTPGMPLGAAGYGAMPGMPSPEKIAGCLGLSPKEFQDLSDPTHGQPRPMNNEEMKRQAELAKRLDMQRYQACMLQQ